MTKASTFKRRAPRAVKAVKEFAEKAMFTKDVRLDTKLNKFLWSQVCNNNFRIIIYSHCFYQGIKNVPYRVRVRLSRKVCSASLLYFFFSF